MQRCASEDPMGRLDGKIALVTGGSAGIGLASAKRLVAEGAHVFITGRRAAELDGAAREIGRNVTAIAADVAKLADLDGLYTTIRAAKQRVDIVVANAGILEDAPLAEVTQAHYDRIFDVNVRGVLFTVQKALPLLSEGAAVILMGSIVGSKGFARRSVYNATKAVLRSFARTWTTELAPRRIRVNVVSPGVIDTAMARDIDRTDTEGLTQRYVDRIPLGRVGTPDDIAKVVAFLASDDASYIAGAEIFADGGLAQV
jgi:NAD(P)-dependent dehydrogenase (short-subunit alcohol dehydrogenase family)